MVEQNKKELTDLFENILGVKITIEDIFDSPESKNKCLFIRFINTIEEITIRGAELYGLYGIDISRMEDMHFSVIDDLISLHYSPKSREVIYWYLYERFDEDGNEYPLEDEEGKTIFVSSAETLYEVVKLMEK